MLHNEARELLVEGYETTHNAEAIAKIFHVNKYTVYHLEEQKRKTGSVDLQTWRRGRKALLNSADKARIAQCIAKNRTISLEEMRTQLYYFRIHLNHLLAPFPFWRPLIPLSVALLRCVSFALAGTKNSRRIWLIFIRK